MSWSAGATLRTARGRARRLSALFVLACLVALWSAAAAHAGFTAAQSSPITIGVQFPFSVALGNLDTDGHLDFVTANPNSNDLSVFLGDGHGGFAAAPGSPVMAGAKFDQFVAIGRLNGDSNPDVATANGEFMADGSASVLLSNGSAGLSPAVGSPFPVGAGIQQTRSVAIGDLNGDAKADLAATSWSPSGRVSVLLGNGNGGFALTPGSPMAVGCDAPDEVAIGDLNGNGSPDLAIACQNAGLAILLNDGGGGFAPAPGSPLTSVGSIRSVAIGQFTPDAIADLAVGAISPSRVEILVGDGAGGFSMAPGSPIMSGGGWVSVADLNGDSKDDVATVAEVPDTVSVLLGDGEAGFSATSQSPFGVGAQAPVQVEIGDVNKDGKPDLATANFSGKSVSVFLNTTPTISRSPARLTFGAQPPGTTSAAQVVSLTNAGPTGQFTVRRVFTTGALRADVLLAGDTCTDRPIPVGGSCEVSVRFAPQATGPRNGVQLEFRSDGFGAPTTELSGGTLPDTTAPVFFAARLTNTTFAIDPRGAPEKAVAASAKRGTKFVYRVSEASRVLFTIERKQGGRKVGKTCRKPSRTNRRRKACTRFATVGRFAQAAAAGPNTNRFSGRISKRKLKPGRYRATLRAKDPAGNASAAKRLNFTVVRK
jgi:hypothetical protein